MGLWPALLFVRIGTRVVLPAGQIDGRMSAPLRHGRHDGVAATSWSRMRRGRGGKVLWLLVSLQRHRDDCGLLLLLLRDHGEGRQKRRLMRLLMLRQRLLLTRLI